jgi:FtsZ-interacting cell division protein YlmF
MPDKEEKPKKKQNQPKHHAPKSRAIAKMRRKKIYKYIAEGKTHQEAGELVGFSKKTARQQVEGILSQPIFKAEFQKILDKDVPDKDVNFNFSTITDEQLADIIAGKMPKDIV